MALRAVGLLSPGDMGHVVGQVLVNQGMTVLTCLEGRSERTRGLARQAGIEAVGSMEDLVRRSDLILSILVPGEAQNAARVVSRAVRDTGVRLIYVDCNAIAPSTAQAIGKILEEAGSGFVDAGIIGPPPRQRGSTRFYASGKEAGVFEELKAYGLDVRVIGKEIGQASGLKMTYAALTKGFGALSLQLLTAAQRMGLWKNLTEEFQLSQKEPYASMERMLPGIPPKAKRWVGEMEEIAKTFSDLSLTPKIFQGAAEVYRFVGKTPLSEETPETRDKNRTLAQMIETLAAFSE